jgi:hypothetical protein
MENQEATSSKYVCNWTALVGFRLLSENIQRGQTVLPKIPRSIMFVYYELRVLGMRHSLSRNLKILHQIRDWLVIESVAKTRST